MSRHTPLLSTSMNMLLLLALLGVTAYSQAAKCTFEDKTYPDARTACAARLATETPPERVRIAEVDPSTGDVHCAGFPSSEGATPFDQFMSGVKCETGSAAIPIDGPVAPKLTAKLANDGKTPGPWSRSRIAVIAHKRVIVGIHAIVIVKGKALEGIKMPTAFATLRGDDKQVAALGNGGTVALLPEIQVKKSYQPSSGYMLKPTDASSSVLEFIAWNSGEPVRDYNASHAEYQFISYIESAGDAWLRTIVSIKVEIYGRDVCDQCEADLKRFAGIIRGRSPNAVVEWRRAD